MEKTKINHCRMCNKKIPISLRYCSKSCRTIYSNKKRTNPKLLEKVKCKLCNKKLIFYKSAKRKFCSHLHSFTYRLKKDYFQTKKILKNLNSDFLYWFVGFWEGEGSLSKNVMSASQNDKNMLKYIQIKLGFGKITPIGNCYDWHIFKQGQMLALIEKIHPLIISEHRKQQIKKFYNDRTIQEFLKYV